MKTFLSVIAVLFCSIIIQAQPISSPPDGGNQHARITQWVGPVEITIDYHSPDVHGPNGEDRTGKIWGTSVAHNGFIDQGFGTAKAAPWRAGSNENTTISFSHDVRIEGKDLKAGTYGLFLALNASGPWTWIFSKNSTSWGSYFYDVKEDALRVDAAPADGPYTEYLTYGFDERKPSSATAFLQWENKRIPMKIEVPNVNEIYLTKIRQELRNANGFDARNFANAAQFCVQNKMNLEEALVWANEALNPNLGGTEDFFTLRTKAMVLEALGKVPDANVIMDKAIKLPSATVPAIHQYGRSLLQAGQKEKALEVFQYNAKTHPEDKFTPSVGLARGYTAMGDKKNGIKYWELAIQNIPEGQKANIAFYEGELKKLKESK